MSMKIIELNKKTRDEAERILNCATKISDSDYSDFIICAPEAEAEARRIAKLATKKTYVHVCNEFNNLIK